MEKLLIPSPAQVEQGRGGYVIDNHQYKRVTSILKVIDKPGLITWAAKLGLAEMNKVMDTRSAFGTAVHKHCADILRGNVVNVDDMSDWEMRDCVKSYLLWKDTVKLGDYQTEAVVYSKTYGFAGTTDFYGDINGHPSVIDLKTSKDVYIEAFLQVSAYCQCIFEMTGLFPQYGGVLALRDTGYTFKYVDEMTLRGLFPVFLSAMKIHSWKAGPWLNSIQIRTGSVDDAKQEEEL